MRFVRFFCWVKSYSGLDYDIRQFKQPVRKKNLLRHRGYWVIYFFVLFIS